MGYRPLPSNLTIKESKIDGLGLFAKYFIPINTNLGISHIKKESQTDLIRTPLGGFINHSVTPNCTIISDNGFNLVAKFNILAGEELTLDYSKEFCGSLYSLEEPWLTHPASSA